MLGFAFEQARRVITAVGATRVNARIVNAWILGEVDLIARVVHVSRTTEASCAHYGAINAGGFHAERRIVYLRAGLGLNIGAIPRLGAVFVLRAVTLIAVKCFKKYK